MGKRRNLLQQIKACAKISERKKEVAISSEARRRTDAAGMRKSTVRRRLGKKVPEEKSAGCAETVFVFTAKKRGAKTEELIFCPKAGIASNEKFSSERSEPFDSLSAAACFNSDTGECDSLHARSFAPAWKTR